MTGKTVITLTNKFGKKNEKDTLDIINNNEAITVFFREFFLLKKLTTMFTTNETVNNNVKNVVVIVPTIGKYRYNLQIRAIISTQKIVKIVYPSLLKKFLFQNSKYFWEVIKIRMDIIDKVIIKNFMRDSIGIYIKVTKNGI